MKAIIVEDNRGAANVLASYLGEYPENIELVGIAKTIQEAKQLITDHKPNLWFLDIQLSENTVFELLSSIENRLILSSALIFTTAYYQAEYLHDALRNAAVDYITKPVDREELFRAIDIARDRLAKSDVLRRLDTLEQGVRAIHTHTKTLKLPIHRVNGNIDVVDASSIVFIETSDLITRVHLADECITTTKMPKYYGELLEELLKFVRISKPGCNRIQTPSNEVARYPVWIRISANLWHSKKHIC